MSSVFWLFLSLFQAAAPALSGEWNHVDFRSVETVSMGSCARVWLEERKYVLQSTPGNRFEGVHQNVVRAIPVGAASFSPDCKYPDPTSNPIASQMRMWNVVASPLADHRWRLRAAPGPGFGDFSTLKADEFSTELHPVSGRVFDGTGNDADANAVLVFRSPLASPADARAVLQTAVTRLNSGGCLEVMGALATKKEVVAQLCAIRQQISELQGRFVSISVQAETEFDRVPAAFDTPGKTGFRRQRGVFFEFSGTYSNARVPGNAVVIEENGKWRLASLWF